nr:ABC transporter ATP-binding protein [Nanoarchaeum sp.]
MEELSGNKLLEVKNVKKYFGKVKAVDGCSFKIREGTITALVGPNGAGKSTLFNLILGIIKTDEGKILFKKRDITNLPPEKVSNLGVSLLFQQPRLLNNLTVSENILLAFNNEDTKFWKNLFSFNKDDRENLKTIKTNLKLLRIDNCENKLVRDLSYGQKRLVELIRTIFDPHDILLLDEPFMGVNPVIKNSIKEILFKLKKQGETILFIEHDPDVIIGIADEIILMNEGRIVNRAEPERILLDF